MLRGAFWECLAHKEFRENACVLNKNRKKVSGRKRNLLDWFSDIFKLKHVIEEEFEENSATIFDKIAPIFKDKELLGLIPNLKIIIM